MALSTSICRTPSRVICAAVLDTAPSPMRLPGCAPPKKTWPARPARPACAPPSPKRSSLGKPVTRRTSRYKGCCTSRCCDRRMRMHGSAALAASGRLPCRVSSPSSPGKTCRAASTAPPPMRITSSIPTTLTCSTTSPASWGSGSRGCRGYRNRCGSGLSSARGAVRNPARRVRPGGGDAPRSSSVAQPGHHRVR